MPDEVVRRKIDKLLTLFHYEDGKPMYQGKLCVPRKAISTVMQLAHDARTAGHFGCLKTLSRLRNYHWEHESRDVKNYVQGCLICQLKKDHMGRS